MAPLLRELKRIMRLRLSEMRDVAGYDMAALRIISLAAKEKKQSFLTYNETQTKDIWGNLGLASDAAATLERGGKRK